MKNETQSGAVAGMILVNNGYGESFQMLRHSQWNGMTPCDLVFPFFLFIMGVSCYVSMSRRGFQSSPAMLRKVVRRTLLLFAIGLFINWFELAMKGTPLDLQHLRLWAVLQRIALCYLAVSLFALYAPHRYTLHTAAALLVAYAIIIICGNGYAEDASANILAQADRTIFGYDHLYHKSPVDPEGLLGTISSVAHSTGTQRRRVREASLRRPIHSSSPSTICLLNSLLSKPSRRSMSSVFLFFMDLFFLISV